MSEPLNAPTVQALEPRDCTLLRLRRTTRRVTQIYDHHLAPLGLRITQYSLLGNLQHRPPMPIGAFAEIMGMDRTTLTRNIQPLIRAGWVELAAGTDRRQRAIALTAAGRAQFRRAVPLWRQAEQALRAVVGEEAIGQLQRLLDQSLERIVAPT
ncbi:MAG TPA: MarR family winged helix-turn-helix transcriptional regulator [Vineibacter sp.]|nr:MarR family winged helix-turn-helix transcriptional regulator [Vineibacter sp.]